MAWIELHQTLERHPKVMKLMKLVKISRLEAIGLLVVFWLWCLDFAQDGDLSRYEPDEMAEAIGWRGDPVVLFDAMVAAGLVDDEGDRLVVHDWADYAGRLLEKREANAKRMRDARATNAKPARNARATVVQRTCDERATHVQGLPNQTKPNQTKPNQTVPNQTVPNQTVPNQTNHALLSEGLAGEDETEVVPFEDGPAVDPEEAGEDIELKAEVAAPQPPVAAAPLPPKGPDLTRPARGAPKPEKDAPSEAFQRWYARYPNKVNKAQSAEFFDRELRGKTTEAEIHAGLDRYLASDKWTRDNGRYIEAPNVWLSNRRWLDEPEPYNAPSAVVTARNHPAAQRRAGTTDDDIAQAAVMYRAMKGG